MPFGIPRPAWKIPKKSSHGIQSQFYKCQNPSGLNPAIIVKGNKKENKSAGKRRPGKSWDGWRSGGGELTKDMEKAKCSVSSSIWVFMGKPTEK